MNLNKTLYLSYTNLPGHDPYFRVLDEEATLELILQSAPVMKQVGTRLRIRSPKPTDPPIDVACITSARFDQSEAERINQLTINWLMDNDLLPMQV